MPELSGWMLTNWKGLVAPFFLLSLPPFLLLWLPLSLSLRGWKDPPQRAFFLHISELFLYRWKEIAAGCEDVSIVHLPQFLSFSFLLNVHLIWVSVWSVILVILLHIRQKTNSPCWQDGVYTWEQLWSCHYNALNGFTAFFYLMSVTKNFLNPVETNV